MRINIYAIGPKPCKDQILGGCVCGSNGAATTKAAVEEGYRAIWGPPSSWYLSCYADQCASSGNGAGFEPWEHVFAQEPFLCRGASAQGCGRGRSDVSITDPEQQERRVITMRVQLIQNFKACTTDI